MGIDTLTASQESDLLAVANQCSKNGGHAVYRARSLYNLFVSHRFEENSLCNPLPIRRLPDDPQIYSIGEIMVYPNPSEGSFHIQLPEKARIGTYQLSVYNVDAKQVWVKENSAGEDGKWRISLAHLPRGVYWLRISGEEVFAKRIIIQ